MITIIGLGIQEGDITLNAQDAIEKADAVYVKTKQTSTYNYFVKNNIETHNFDWIYDTAEDFSDLNQKIIAKLLSVSADKNVVFCVNGNGADDATIVELSKIQNVQIISGVGHLDNGLKYYPDTSVMQYSAYDVISSLAFFPDKRHTVIIKEIDNRLLAGDLKLILQNIYGDDKKLMITNLENSCKISINDIDKQKFYDYSTACVIPSESFLEAKRHDFCDLIELMENLMGDNGCPWDRAQTHESIRINLIEEAYELVNAIDKNDIDNMIEETGDVLLQAVFHAMLGKRGAEYNQTDVLSGLCSKLIGRHTHIFGENKASNSEEALKSWDNAKNVEKEFLTISDKLDSLPENLPSLLLAYKTQKIVAKVGFDWEDIDGTYEKLFEEIDELKRASGDDIVKEAGDVLFSTINVLRWLKVEPELALRGACEKFVNRFKYMEGKIIENGELFSDAAVREHYWEESKKLFM
ncbi:MAG: nucleoside triphosphate pyrophosphohydrolase [Clostridia bacterium]